MRYYGALCNIVTMLLLMFSHSSFSKQLKFDSWETCKKRRSGDIVITYCNTPGLAHKINNKRTGVCFDIMEDFVNYIKAQYNVTLQINYKDIADPADFGLFVSTVRNASGGVFGLADVTITPERKKY